jgi:hypothetical protein
LLITSKDGRKNLFDKGSGRLEKVVDLHRTNEVRVFGEHFLLKFDLVGRG